MPIEFGIWSADDIKILGGVYPNLQPVLYEAVSRGKVWSFLFFIIKKEYLARVSAVRYSFRLGC